MPITLMAAMAAAQGAKGIADTIIGTSQRRKGQAEFDKLTSQPIERGAMASEYGRYLDTVMGAAGKAESMGRQALQRGVATAGEAASRTGDASSAMDVALKAARGEEELGLKGAADIASAFQTVGGVKQSLLDAQRIRTEGRQDYMIDMAAASAEAGRQQQMAGIGSLIDAGAYAATLSKGKNNSTGFFDNFKQKVTGTDVQTNLLDNLSGLSIEGGPSLMQKRSGAAELPTNQGLILSGGRSVLGSLVDRSGTQGPIGDRMLDPFGTEVRSRPIAPQPMSPYGPSGRAGQQKVLSQLMNNPAFTSWMYPNGIPLQFDRNIGAPDTGIFISRNGMNMGSVQKTPSGYNHDNGDDLAIVDKDGNDTGMRVEGDEYIINHEQAETLKEAAMSGNKELLMRAALKIFSQPQFQ